MTRRGQAAVPERGGDAARGELVRGHDRDEQRLFATSPGMRRAPS